MEQGLSFIVVIGLITIGLILHSPVWILTTFTIGSGYLLIRGKRKGWSWKR
jgi:hypothetical protein